MTNTDTAFIKLYCGYYFLKVSKTHLKSYPLSGCKTSGAILHIEGLLNLVLSNTLKSSRKVHHIHLKSTLHRKLMQIGTASHQHGVPTNVFLKCCLSPLSNMHAETPKSPSFTPPELSRRMFPA